MATRAVACLENEPLALFILEKREELFAADGFKESLDATISKAYRNVCECKQPICSLRDASKIKGIGNWMLKLLKGFFPEENSADCDPNEGAEKATKRKAKKSYLPQKGSAPYAILLTLYRAIQEGSKFMKKQELIDAAEASGLSRMPIQPKKCAGPSGQFGYSTNDWYSGWSSMKTLHNKGLVAKSSCPAKYMLTEEGKSTAEECLQRSGTLIHSGISGPREGMKKCSTIDSSEKGANSPKMTHATSSKKSRSSGNCIALDGVNQVNAKFSSLSDSDASLHIEDIADVSSDVEEEGNVDSFTSGHEHTYKMEDSIVTPSQIGGVNFKSAWLHLPPLQGGEMFIDLYDVVLILDDREQFMRDGKGQNIRNRFVDQLVAQFQVSVEIRHLPLGDALWLARHKLTREEYVLDFIIERKKVNDLLHSIRDTRYKQQKLRLLRCGLRKLIYVVEGDPNVMDSAESIKTACFTTEIAEGFDVQRTRDTTDTLRKYGYLTHAITIRYNELSSHKKAKQGLCKTYTQFLNHCKDLEKEKVSDVFGVMLMQVKHVTENIALSILEKYPTPLSLVSAYSRLEGNARAQEQLLKGIPIMNQNKEISNGVSKSVYEFICSSAA